MKKNPVIVAATVATVKKAKPDCPKLEGNAAKRAREFLEILRLNHVAMGEMLPLQIEVNKQLHRLYPNVSRKIVNMALYYHTSSLGYLESIVKGFGRYTVDKVFIQGISPEDREKALTLLKKIKNKLFRPKGRTAQSKPRPMTQTRRDRPVYGENRAKPVHPYVLHRSQQRQS